MSKKTPGEDDWIFDPALAAMNRQLQRELRDEAEEVESVIADSELRERTFADIASDARNRGDMVGVVSTRRSFNGHVVYAAGDLLTMRVEDALVDIPVNEIAHLRVLEVGRGRGGTPAEDGPGTFAMRLLEQSTTRQRVEIGFKVKEETMFGRIGVTGQDHIVLVDDHGLKWMIPITSISWMIRRSQRQSR